MSLLDTHIWIWWTLDPARLTERQVATIRTNETHVVGASVISCWEIAKLVEC